MDVETFFGKIRGSVTNLTVKELQDLDSAKVQMTAWVRFRVEGKDGNVMWINMLDKVFKGRMMKVFQGSDVGEIIEEMFAFKAKFNDWRRMANLLLIVQERKRHYAALKSLSGLLTSSNSENGHQQRSCKNCLQDSTVKSSGTSTSNIM